MKILVYGINYSPELTGIGKYTGEMCEWLAQRGHSVEVITAMPYYPHWKVKKEYRGKLWHSEVLGGVKVLRCPLYIPKKVTGYSRIVHEFSFFLSSLIFWIPRLFRKFDVVLAIYPPLTIGPLPLIYKKLHKTILVTHVQDLQVDAAKELKLIKRESLLNFFEGCERMLFKGSDFVSSISEGMKQRIIKKGVGASNYMNFPNWAEVDFIKPLPKNESLRKEFGFSETDKVILYSGNMGEKQGLDIIVDSAKRLKDRTNVYFALFGEGTFKNKLVEMVNESGLTNVKFYPLQTYEKLPALLAMADVHLVLQKKAAADLVLPSKFLSIVSSGGLAIVTASPNTTLYDIIEHHKIAKVIEPENPEKLYNALTECLDKDYLEIRKNARAFAENQLNIKSILERFEMELLREIKTI